MGALSFLTEIGVARNDCWQRMAEYKGYLITIAKQLETRSLAIGSAMSDLCSDIAGNQWYVIN